MRREEYARWHGRPVFVLVHDDEPQVPDDLRANIDHAIRLTLKIEKLKAARKEAMMAAAESARRWRPISPSAAHRLCAQLMEFDVPFRGLVRSALAIGSNGRRTVEDYIVYVLLHKGTVTYVGRSERHAASRVSRHHARGLLFDEVMLYECRDAAHMTDLEAVLIDQYRPLHNQRMERRVAGEAS